MFVFAVEEEAAPPLAAPASADDAAPARSWKEPDPTPAAMNEPIDDDVCLGNVGRFSSDEAAPPPFDSPSPLSFASGTESLASLPPVVSVSN